MSFPCWRLSFEEVFKLRLIVADQVFLQLIDTVTVLRLDRKQTQMKLHKNAHIKKKTIIEKRVLFASHPIRMSLILKVCQQ